MKRPTRSYIPALLALGSLVSQAAAQSITLESNIVIPDGGEIIAFSKDTNTVATNVGGAEFGVQLYTLQANATLAPREFVDLSAQLGGAILSVSSVALDPLGRNFGVASVIPTANGTTEGVVVFFDSRTGTASVLDSVTVGFHPDSVIFSRDGSKVFVANEGEFTVGGNSDAPGSVSIIDLSGITAVGDVAANIDNGDVTTVDFSPAGLAAGVDLDDLRFNDSTFTAGNAHRHVEPEYLTEGDDKVYATLQENNAIAEISLSGPNANKVTAIFPLGTIEQLIDASDEDGPADGPAAKIDDLVKGMPMPDTLASFVVGGVRYLATANEGDFRGDDDDRIRVKDFSGIEPGSGIDTSDAALGRLRVLKDVSDPDNNDLIDEPIMPGTRSFSIWNASTGALVGDTGSFETLLLAEYPEVHNIDGESGTDTFDDRSDDKGPEPEALATGSIDGNQYVFVGMERQGAILMYQVNDPTNPTYVTSINNVTDGLVAPESITFIPAANSPTGKATLLIGYEVGGRIGVYSVVGATQPPVVTPRLPSLTVRPVIRTAPRARTALVSGRASDNTASVKVSGKRARGTSKWNARLPFPIKKKRMSARVVATSTDGLRAAKTVRILRRTAR